MLLRLTILLFISSLIIFPLTSCQSVDSNFSATPSTLTSVEDWLSNEKNYSAQVLTSLEPTRSDFFRECMEDERSGILPCAGCEYELRSIDGHVQPFLYRYGDLVFNFNEYVQEGAALSHLRISDSWEKLAFVTVDSAGTQTVFIADLSSDNPTIFNKSGLSIATIEFGGNDLYVLVRDPALHPVSVAIITGGEFRNLHYLGANESSVELTASPQSGVILSSRGVYSKALRIREDGINELVSPQKAPFKIVDTPQHRFMIQNAGEKTAELFICNSSCINRRSIIRSSEQFLITDLESKGSNLVVFGRRYGKQLIKIVNNELSVYEPRFQGENGETKLLRSYPGLHFHYSSLNEPTSIFKIEENTGQYSLIWRETPPKYNPDDYVVSELEVASKDRSTVSISLVSTKGSDQKPILVSAYGAYGIPAQVRFPREYLPFLRRGISLGISHIRGGGEFGNMWHSSGSGINKKRSLDDLEAIIGRLKQPVALHTRSAGGILGANIAINPPINLKGVSLERPFLDPYRRGILEENSEWGRLDDPIARSAMQDWSPFNKDIPSRVPPLYVSASPLDKVVPFESILEWVQKVRRSEASPLLVFNISSNASHEGGALKEICEERAARNAFLYSVLR